MPHLVEHIVSAAHVKKGDVYGGRTVYTKKTGTKWTELREEDGMLILRTLNEDPISVAREVPTDEERAAVEAERAAERRARSNEDIEAWVRTKIGKFEERMHGYTLKIINGSMSYSYDSYGSMMEEQAEFEIAQAVKSIFEQGLKSDEDRSEENLEFWAGRERDWVNAFELWVEQAKEELTSRYSVRALSRSTSVISNLLEDVKRSITLELANGMFRF